MPVSANKGKITIHYIGDLAWFSRKNTIGKKYSSPVDALKAHIRYVTRSKECVLSKNLDLDEWTKKAYAYLDKRANSRLAGKLVLALPNDLKPKQAGKLIEEFFSERFDGFFTRTKEGKINVKPRLGYAIHSGKNSLNDEVPNLHAHILFDSRADLDDKEVAISIDRKGLSKLHADWEKFLESKGYAIFKTEDKEPHYGPIARSGSGVFNEDAYEAYWYRRKAAKIQRKVFEHQLGQRVNQSEKPDRAFVVLPKKDASLLSWDELLREQATQGRKSKKVASSRRLRPRKGSRKTVNKTVKTVRKIDVPKGQKLQENDEIFEKDAQRQIKKIIERDVAEKRKKEQIFAEELSRNLQQMSQYWFPPDDDFDWDPSPP